MPVKLFKSVYSKILLCLLFVVWRGNTMWKLAEVSNVLCLMKIDNKVECNDDGVWRWMWSDNVCVAKRWSQNVCLVQRFKETFNGWQKGKTCETFEASSRVVVNNNNNNAENF